MHSFPWNQTRFHGIRNIELHHLVAVATKKCQPQVPSLPDSAGVGLGLDLRTWSFITNPCWSWPPVAKAAKPR